MVGDALRDPGRASWRRHGGALALIVIGLLAPAAAYGVVRLLLLAIGDWFRASEDIDVLRCRQYVLLLGAGQGTFAAVALLGARRSKQLLTARLGLVAPRASRLTLGLVVVGGLVPLFAGHQLRALCFSEPSPHLVEFFTDLGDTRWPLVGVVVLALGVWPAIGEELLYRGLLQNGLLARWRPLPAVLLSGLTFAAVHVDPQHILLVALPGLWISYVFWRTGSILPCVLLHFLGNVAAGVLIAVGWVDLERVHPLLVAIALALCLPALVLAVVRLERSARSPAGA